MPNWFEYKDALGFFLTFISGIGVVLFAFILQRISKRKKLIINKNEVCFHAMAKCDLAEDLFNNNGLAFIVSIELESQGGDISISRVRLTIKNNMKNIVMVGTLTNKAKNIKLLKEDYKSVSFIFDPSPYCKNLNEMIHSFVGATCTIDLLNTNNQKIKCNGTKLLIKNKDINVIESKQQYLVKIPPLCEKEDATRLCEILNSAGIRGVVIEKKRVGQDLNKVIKFPIIGRS